MFLSSRLALSGLPLRPLRQSLAQSRPLPSFSPLLSTRTYATKLKQKQKQSKDDSPRKSSPKTSSSIITTVTDGSDNLGSSHDTPVSPFSPHQPSKDRRGVQLKKPVPRTPGLRHVRRPINDHLWKGRPLKKLTFPKKGHGKAGRNQTGRVTVRHRGGGHKRRIRTVDFKRLEPGAHLVERVEHDPNRSGHIALIKNKKTGEQSYILAVEGLRAGDTVESYRAGIPKELQESMGGRIDHGMLAARTARPGNCLPLDLVPVGTVICNIGLRPKGGGQMCRGAGTYGVLVSKQVELPDRFDEIWKRVEGGEVLVQNADGKIILPEIQSDAGNEEMRMWIQQEVDKRNAAHDEAMAQIPGTPQHQQLQQQQEQQSQETQDSASTDSSASATEKTQPNVAEQSQQPQSQVQQQPTEQSSETANTPTATEEALAAQAELAENQPAKKLELRDGESKVTIQSLREMRRRSQNVVIRLSSGEIRYIHMKCCATIGKVSNPDYKYRQIGKAGRSRWLGIRPTVRGVAMNAKDHPHGGGRGKSKGNVHPKSPWGLPAKSGYRTRPKWKVNKAVLVQRPRNQGKRRRGYH